MSFLNTNENIVKLIKSLFIVYIFFILILKILPEVIIALFLTYSFHDKKIVKDSLKIFDYYLNTANMKLISTEKNELITQTEIRKICKGFFKNGKPCNYKTNKIYCKRHEINLDLD
jgi:hypothetical protein